MFKGLFAWINTANPALWGHLVVFLGVFVYSLQNLTPNGTSIQESLVLSGAVGVFGSFFFGNWAACVLLGLQSISQRLFPGEVPHSPCDFQSDPVVHSRRTDYLETGHPQATRIIDRVPSDWVPYVTSQHESLIDSLHEHLVPPHGFAVLRLSVDIVNVQSGYTRYRVRITLIHDPEVWFGDSADCFLSEIPDKLVESREFTPRIPWDWDEDNLIFLPDWFRLEGYFLPPERSLT